MKVDFLIQPGVYFRYVDDTFLIFGSELDCDCSHKYRNFLHPALKFTVQMEQNTWNFLAVLVEKDSTGYLTSIYRKRMLTGHYIR